MVSVSRDAGGHLVLAQQRFNICARPLPGGAGARAALAGAVQLRVHGRGGSLEGRVLLAGREARLRLGEGRGGVVANAGGNGFYRVRYAPDLLEALLKRLDMLAPIERFNLVNDAWAMAVAGLMPLTAYLDLTARFRDEHVLARQKGSRKGC